MTREAEARSWNETTGNVWHRLAACDHLLDTESWKHGDPPQGPDISFATATRHLRILRQRIEEIMGTSARHQDTHQMWRDLSKEQWVPGLQTVWLHLTDHIKQDQKVTRDTIRSWRLSLARDNHKNHSECPTCQVRHMDTCTTCHRPRCGIATCKASKTL